MNVFLTFTIIISLLTSMAACAAAPTSNNSGFRPFGQTIVGSPSLPIGLRSIVKLSDDGSRMAIGAASKESGAIFLYERRRRHSSSSPTTTRPMEEEDVEDIARETYWFLIWETIGNGLGRNLALSGNGDYLVFQQGNHVQTFHVPTSTTASLTTCVGTSLEIGTSSISSLFGEMHWLVVGCQAFYDLRGRVEIYRLNDETWVPLFNLSGAIPRARFGWDIDFVSFYDRIIIAISSPDYSLKRGMVKLYQINPSLHVSQLGREIIGETTSDQFGMSLSLSREGEKPLLVVGAPGSSDKRGCVTLYNWARPGIGDKFDWTVVGEPLIGDYPGMRFGRAVVVVSGGRMAAGSYHYNTHRGLIKLYSVSRRSIVLVGVMEGKAPVDRLGQAIAMNAAGSILASVRNNNVVGSVAVSLDDHPFCGLPSIDSSKNEMFLTRPVCRDYMGAIAESPEQCSILHSWQDGVSCEWISDLSTITPSAMPSSRPSLRPTTTATQVPSASPSAAPTENPTEGPTCSPSASPSSSPTSEPTGTPTTEAPTFHPTPASSRTPTSPSTHGPTGAPRSIPTSVPTSSSTGGTSNDSDESDDSLTPSLSPSVNHTITPSNIPSLSPSSTAPTTKTENKSSSSKLRHNDGQSSGIKVKTASVVSIFVAFGFSVGLGFLITNTRRSQSDQDYYV